MEYYSSMGDGGDGGGGGGGGNVIGGRLKALEGYARGVFFDRKGGVCGWVWVWGRGGFEIALQGELFVECSESLAVVV